MNDKDTDPPHSSADEWRGAERRRGDRRSHNRRASDAQQSGLPSTREEFRQLVGQIVAEQQVKAVPQKPKVKQPTADPALPHTQAELRSIVGGMVSEIVERGAR